MTTKRAVFLGLSIVVMMLLLAAGLLGQSMQKDNVYRYLSVFTEVLSIVNTNYVEDVSSAELIDGAFGGVTQAIDEFSYYIPPSEMPRYRKASEGDALVDPGIVVTKRFGYAFAISVAPGSAAALAGLGPGDLIESIDGARTEPLAIWQAAAALRGESGDVRKLKVVHGGMTKREEIEIKLGTGKAAAIERREYGSIAYVKVPDFSSGTADNLEKALGEIRAQSKKAVILDLRANAMGDPAEAIRCADLFLSKGTITSVVGRKVENKAWLADRATAWDGDLAVLTDSSSAEGSEVVAAAIAGNKRGRVVGLPTYGKAIVQKLVDLPSGGGLYLTIGHYTTPELKPIKELGVKPDITIERAIPEPDKLGDEDPILDKALSLFEEKAEKAAA